MGVSVFVCGFVGMQVMCRLMWLLVGAWEFGVVVRVGGVHQG